MFSTDNDLFVFATYIPSFSRQYKTEKQASFILFAITLHPDKCNTVGRTNRWINFRRNDESINKITARDGYSGGEFKREFYNAEMKT